MKTLLYILCLVPLFAQSQSNYDAIIDKRIRATLLQHKDFVSIPNLPENPELMFKNMAWVEKKYEALGFTTTHLKSETLPILLTEKVYDPALKTILFYVHIDGQPVNPAVWDQEDPFTPVLKKQTPSGTWTTMGWDALDQTINDDWRIYGRAAADDKAPILMFITALEILQEQGKTPNFNIKVIFDPQEEYGSTALLGTLDTYKTRYAADYFIVMDGPAHSSNRPTLTFGCRGIATCEITTYGATLPQHSGHYGNYVPNPAFRLSHLLSSMKDDDGKVLIDGYYDGVTISPEQALVMQSVPFTAASFNKKLGLHSAEKVGANYQEALQYPTLNVRQLNTSWTGKGLKTVVPSTATAHLDVRLVPEISGDNQLDKIVKHISNEGYYVLDRLPTAQERLSHKHIATVKTKTLVNAFRTNPQGDFGVKMRERLTQVFNKEPVTIRMMGGTVPIVPLINTLNLPTVILPLVNMDNNQHNPNENIRIGNMRQGIKVCLGLLETNF